MYFHANPPVHTLLNPSFLVHDNSVKQEEMKCLISVVRSSRGSAQMEFVFVRSLTHPC